MGSGSRPLSSVSGICRFRDLDTRLGTSQPVGIVVEPTPTGFAVAADQAEYGRPFPGLTFPQAKPGLNCAPGTNTLEKGMDRSWEIPTVWDAWPGRECHMTV
ncbi:MAG: hypothetical protein RLZZ34_584 [Verrucomicrobiota bacterium]